MTKTLCSRPARLFPQHTVKFDAHILNLYALPIFYQKFHVMIVLIYCCLIFRQNSIHYFLRARFVTLIHQPMHIWMTYAKVFAFILHQWHSMLMGLWQSTLYLWKEFSSVSSQYRGVLTYINKTTYWLTSTYLGIGHVTSCMDHNSKLITGGQSSSP